MLNGKVDVQLSYVMICMCETLHPMQATLYPDVYIRLLLLLLLLVALNEKIYNTKYIKYNQKSLEC